MVLGASRRSRLATLLAGKSIPTKLARRAGHIDAHLVSRKVLAEHSRPLAAFRHRTRTRQAAAEAAALSRLAVSVLSGHGDPPALLEEIREMFGLASVSLLEQRDDGTAPRWYVMASAGDRPPDDPAEVSLPVAGTVVLAGRERTLNSGDVRLLSARFPWWPAWSGVIRMSWTRTPRGRRPALTPARPCSPPPAGRHASNSGRPTPDWPSWPVPRHRHTR